MISSMRFRAFPRLVQGKQSCLSGESLRLKRVSLVLRYFIPEKPCEGAEQGEEN